MPSLLDTLAKLMHEHSLPGLLIGGHAVTVLGYPRATFDVDLLIPRSSAELWGKCLLSISYRAFAISANFQQYEAINDFPLPPIDLMLVDDDVYEVLYATKIDAKPIFVPHVQSMIALKLHATKHRNPDDAEKDWQDILALCKAHQLTLDDVAFRDMILRHGGETALGRIKAALTGGN